MAICWPTLDLEATDDDDEWSKTSRQFVARGTWGKKVGARKGRARLIIEARPLSAIAWGAHASRRSRCS